LLISTKMEKTKRKDISEAIELGDAHVEIHGNVIKISKNGVHLERKIEIPIKKEGNNLILDAKKATKNIKRNIKTTAAHLRNMLAGLDKKYVYKLQICAVHFPMTTSIKGNEIIIKNFLGEVKDRKATIIEGVSVKVDKEIITVEGHDKEKTGQTAANIENATRITKRDRRVFQDGIYIISKEKGVRKAWDF